MCLKFIYVFWKDHENFAKIIPYSFRIMAMFYFINWIVAAETIEGGKLFKGGNYSRKYVKCLRLIEIFKADSVGNIYLLTWN